MPSLSRIRRLLFLLVIVFGCTADLCAQFTPQAILVGSGSVPLPPPPNGCSCPNYPVAQGSSVALSADGNTALSNGPGDNNGVLGAAWVFTRPNGVWAQQGDKLVGAGAVEPVFASIQSVALSADGNTAILGRSGDNSGVGALWVFTRSNGVWSQQGDKLVGSGSTGSGATGPYQGAAVALSADGNTAVMDGRGDNHNTGAVWVFTRNNAVWGQQGDKLVGIGASGQLFQGSPAISGDGNTILVGSSQPAGGGNGFNWAFSRENGIWSQQGGMLIGNDTGGSVYQGASSALSIDGDTAIVGGFNRATFDAYAWIFVRRSGVWTQQGPSLVASRTVIDSSPNISVALSADGNTALLKTSVFTRDAGGVWTQTETLPATHPRRQQQPIGTVAISSDAGTAIVGIPADNNGAGAALIFAAVGTRGFRGRRPR